MLIHVTGANGRVGVEVTRALAKVGEVHGTDVGEMDVGDMNSVTAVLSARPPDVMVNLAGLKGNLAGQQRPMEFFRVNTVGAVNLLEVCRQLSTKQYIFFSSLVVHGPSEGAIDEDSLLAPAHPYSGTKGASESMVHAYANAYGINAVIFRPSFIVGPAEPHERYVDNLVYDFIDSIHDTGTIELMGDGHYEREWLHPRDIATAVALAISSPRPGCQTYHLCGERVSMYELASRIIKQVGKGRIKTNPDRPGFSVISSSDKARRELGWKPETDLDSLIAEIWNEYQSRNRT